MKRKPDTAKLLPLGQYDLVLVSYSGGKDSIACLLHILELGVEPERIELWHQDVGELVTTLSRERDSFFSKQAYERLH